MVLHGGLGNRLFQVAAACGLAAISGRTWGVLDVDPWVHHDTAPHQRLLELLADCGIPTTNSEWAEGKELSVVQVQEPADSFCHRLEVPQELVTERGILFEFRGYFQSESYWHIRSAAAFMRSLLGRRLADGEPSGGEELSGAWAVHIRRGDYVGHSLFEQLWPDYFDRCIRDIQQRYRALRLVVVSDDREWCERHVLPRFASTTGHSVSLAPPGSGVLHDLRILAACGAGIVCSNSTFSWWGAWAGQNPNRPAYFPRKWFSSKVDGGDLLHNSGVGRIHLM